MSAFANLPGGCSIVLGLDEAAGFEPVRLKNAVALAAWVAGWAWQAFQPELYVDVDMQPVEGSDVVVARVRELAASVKPCFVKRSGRAYLQ